MGFIDLLRRPRARSARRAEVEVAPNVWLELERERSAPEAPPAPAPSRRVVILRAPHRRAPVGSLRNWEPTAQGPLWGDWRADGASADEEIRLRLKLSRERSRNLARTNPYARRFFALYLANVVGESGLTFKPRVTRIGGGPDELANLRLRQEWAAWGERENCTLDGQLSWREVEDLLAISWQRDGEAFLRLIRVPGRNRWGFVVQPIEADQVDESLCTLRGENEIRMGVELEANTRRVVAYWVLNTHPGDNSIARGANRHTRVPADEMIHLFTRDRIDQSRGVPRLEASMARLQMLGGYEEAELVAARAGSSKFAVITTETGAEYEGDDIEGEPGSGGDSSTVLSDFSQGTIEHLGRGQKLDLIDPTHPTSQYAEARKGFLRGAAAGTQVNYNSLANDLEGVNYSSLRHATLEERDQWKREQDHFASIVSNDVYYAWLEASLFSGALTPLLPSSFERYRAVKWGGKRWTWIDPLKEAQGNAASLPFYGKTITEIAEERGRTVTDIAQEIQAERAVFAQYGVEHPLDRKPDPAASSAAPPDLGE